MRVSWNSHSSGLSGWLEKDIVSEITFMRLKKSCLVGAPRGCTPGLRGMSLQGPYLGWASPYPPHLPPQSRPRREVAVLGISLVVPNGLTCEWVADVGGRRGG